MPLTSKGEEILANMKKEYGSKKGESVLYASKNAGKITGIDAAPQASSAAWGKCFAHDCWKTMGKDSPMGSDPSSSIPAASEEEDQAGMIAGKDATSGRGPTDKDLDQPTGFDGKMGLDILKKGMLRLGKPGHR